MLSSLCQLPPFSLGQPLLSPSLFILDFLLKLLEVFAVRVDGMEGDGHILAQVRETVPSCCSRWQVCLRVYSYARCVREMSRSSGMSFWKSARRRWTGMVEERVSVRRRCRRSNFWSKDCCSSWISARRYLTCDFVYIHRIIIWAERSRPRRGKRVLMSSSLVSLRGQIVFADVDKYLMSGNKLDLKQWLETQLSYFIYPMGACMAPQEQRRQGAPPTELANAEEKILCHICMNNIPRSQSFTLTCGHIFGKDCLAQAYTLKIRERNLDIRCPDCSLALQYDVIGKIVPAEVFALYDKTCFINSLILAENIFFCPTADCPGIFEIIPSEFRYFQCRFCSKAFCLICHKQYHGKSECQVDDGGTPEGSLACVNSKCGKPCVKVSGCNIVECLICKTKFCFKCRGKLCGHYHCLNDKKL